VAATAFGMTTTSSRSFLPEQVVEKKNNEGLQSLAKYHWKIADKTQVVKLQ